MLLSPRELSPKNREADYMFTSPYSLITPHFRFNNQMPCRYLKGYSHNSTEGGVLINNDICLD